MPYDPEPTPDQWHQGLGIALVLIAIVSAVLLAAFLVWLIP